MRISMPHPVLAPRHSDYHTGYGFNVDINASIHGDKMRITVKYDLSSTFLTKKIGDGEAKYFLVSKCSKTSHRDVYSSDQSKNVWEVNKDDYSGSVSLTPYIASVKEIESFTSGEHSEDICNFNPKGFHIPAGSILAIADPGHIVPDSDDNLKSIFQMVPDPQVDENRYRISLDNENITIIFNSETHKKIRKLMTNHEDLLFPSVYTAAMEYAIRNMETGEYSDSRWAVSIKSIMEERGISLEDGNYLEVAQKILEDPLTRLFKAIEEIPHDE